MPSDNLYRTDPRSGNKLSALGFGCMRFPRDAALCDELVTSAIEAGINYFDTAHMYSGNEVALGSILNKHNLREKIYIATKLPHSRIRNYSDIEKLFLESLERLKTNYIDYYLIHNIGSLDAFKRLEGIGLAKWIAAKKEAGQISQIGFSFHGKSTDFVDLLDAYDWDFCQIQYNYMNEYYQAGTAGLKAIHERGLASIIMEPLLGGKLAQNLPKEAERIFKFADPGRSPAEWALKWLWDKPEVTVVLSGMTKMEQLAENLKVANSTAAGSLTDAEREVYGKAQSSISGTYKVPCTGCDYCMPCPNGVNIPACFSAYNISFVMGLITGIKTYINSTINLGSTSRSDPGKCNLCGACAKKCPQSIDIPNQLKQAHKRLEPIPLRPVLKIAKRIIG